MSDIKTHFDSNGQIFVTKGNAVLTCMIKIGDKIKIKEFWGPKLGGKKGIVEEIKFHIGCETNFMVKVSCYEGYVDANWLEKIDINEPATAS